jgi:hypothetical protein
LKVETRGKYPGVKIHLDEKEAELLLSAQEGLEDYPLAPGGSLTKPYNIVVSLSAKMGQKIKDLLAENPDLLKPRTPEQIKAILAKEAEKAALQLKTLNATGQFKELDKDALKSALLKHVKD